MHGAFQSEENRSREREREREESSCFCETFQAGYLKQVVGMQREVAVETTPEALNVEHSEPASTGSVETETSTKQVSAKEVETVEKQKNDTSDTSDTSDTREPRGTTVGPDPETQKLLDLEQDEQGEQGDADTEGQDLHAHCGKETQDFQRARVHQARLRTVERFRDGFS